MTIPPAVLGSTAQPNSGSGPKTATFADANPDVMTFVNRRAEITVPIASCKLERTIEGASSLTVRIHDPALSFLNCEAIHGPRHGEIESFVTMENQVFAVAGLHLNKGHIVEVVLEDAVIHALRKNKKPLTMTRGSVTRAEFIKHMFAESGVPLESTELAKRQPIRSTAEAERLALKGKKPKPGLAAHASITVKGQPIDAEQRSILELALQTAVSHSAGEKATVALLISLIQENSVRKPNPLQLEPSTAATDHVDPEDVAAVCALFLTQGFTGQGGAIALSKAHPSWNAGEIAIAVQGPANKNPNVYYAWHTEAEAIVQAFTGLDASVLQESTTFVKAYQFERKNGEDSWTAARRLAEEVGWYLFVLDGTAYFESGKSLKAAKPHDLIAPAADGLIGLPTFGYWTSHHYDDTVTVECHASKWGTPPSAVAELEGFGPVDGRWLVAAIERPAMKSSRTVITLARGKEPQKEPPHELGTRSAEGGGKLVGNWSLPLPNLKTAASLNDRVDQGQDINQPVRTSVFAMTDGELQIATNGPYGSGSGFGAGYPVVKMEGVFYKGYQYIYYGHVGPWTRANMKPGQKVKAGDKIGELIHIEGVGSSGEGHLEVGFATGFSGSPTGSIDGSGGGQDMHVLLLDLIGGKAP